MSFRSQASSPRWALAVFGLALAGALVACGEKKAQAQNQSGPAPAEVSTYTVAPAAVPVEFEYVGQVAGSREVEVRARVTGIVERRLYEEGARVKAGQVLFVIDPSPFKAQVSAAEAELAQAEARHKQTQRDLQRIQPLAATQAVSRKELDDAASAQDFAAAAVQSAQARVETARIDLGYTQVRAPLAGVVGRALKVEGSLANAAGDSLLTTIAQIDPVYVDFGVAEAEQLRLRKEVAEGSLKLAAGGFEVALATSDGTTLDRVGKLDFADYKADPNTGSFAARATLPNADNALAPGQFVRVKLRGAERPNAVTVPQRAVLDAPTGKFVYVVGNTANGPIAEQRNVEVGEWVGHGWVIRKGLQAGDEVIVEGMSRIFFPGAPVVRVAAPAAAAAEPTAATPAAAESAPQP
jgi:membrane fusion protein (multidrug efflux system)